MPFGNAVVQGAETKMSWRSLLTVRYSRYFWSERPTSTIIPQIPVVAVPTHSEDGPVVQDLMSLCLCLWRPEDSLGHPP